MLLGVIPMFRFGILRIFGEKSQKRKTGKSEKKKKKKKKLGSYVVA